jgi:hemoglobin
MRTVSRWGPLLAAACVLVVAGVGRAADEKTAGPVDRKALDTALYNNLRDVINRGAALYNSGDQAGCYRLFEGALMAVRPLLAHHPDLQKAITDGLTGAEQDPMLNRRAFALRAVLDRVRDEINPRGKTAGGGTPAPGPGPGPSPGPGPGPKPAARTAWDRMGGERGVRRIVDDLADVLTKDTKVDFFRGGKYKPTPEEVARMKRMIVEQISSVTGGPLAYEGKSMVEVHKDMGITNAQFDAFVNDFRSVLRKNNVDPKDADDLVSKVEGTRKEIVRPRAPGGGEKKAPKPAAGGQVTGRVTFEGKPLPSGEIALHDATGKTTKGTVKADGSYEIKDVKPGTYKVTVKTDDKDVKIPKQYADPSTSALMYEVRAGNQVLDVDLKK